MEIKYNLTVSQEVIYQNFKKLINQIYKLLPMREESKDWEKPLESIIQEILGMRRLIGKEENLFFLVLCKLEGLYDLQDPKDMFLFRRTIFKCLELMEALRDHVCNR